MKNQGYYSWIHTLKSAAMKSYFNGQKMLNETNGEDYDPNIAANIKKLKAEKAAEIKALKKASDETEAAQRAEIMRGKLSDVKPAGDLTGDGVADAQDVAMDASNNVMGDEDPDMPLDLGMRQPNFGLAAQARMEAGNALPGDVELAKKYETEQPLVSAVDHYKMLDDIEADEAAEEAYKAKEEYGYEIPTADWRTVGESVANKIKMMMNEKLDPVGEEDNDIDNDGEENTKTDKYLAKRRKAIGKAIDKRKTKKS